jgi:hypothetical protein
MLGFEVWASQSLWDDRYVGVWRQEMLALRIHVLAHGS